MFSIFDKKRNIYQTNLLDSMMDVHCHLLPGVDDGVQTAEEAVTAFKVLSEMGITRFLLTPHVREEMSDNNRFFLETQFRKLKAELPAGIEVKLAAEYMLDAAFVTHLQDGLLTMGANEVLVETSYLSMPPNMEDMLYEMDVKGYTPVIAHPERYRYMERKDYAMLKEKGYKFQLNLLSLAGLYGVVGYENSGYLLKNGLYDYVGSDFHDLNMHKKWLRRLFLNKREVAGLERIMANNCHLFDTKIILTQNKTPWTEQNYQNV